MENNQKMRVHHFPEDKRIYVFDQKKLSINKIDRVARKNRLKDYSIEEIKNPGIFQGFLYKLKY